MIDIIVVSPHGRVRKAGNPREILNEAIAALLQLIPLGSVTTYNVLARTLGIHPRYVGLLIKGNSKPVVVPCHRVVMSDGRLGGYTLNKREAVEFKKKLLTVEGVEIRGSRVIKDFIINNLII